MRSSQNYKLKKRNILQLREAVGILHVLSTSPDLSKLTGPCQFSLFLKNIRH